MIVSIDWLRDFVDIDVSLEELADILTNGGFESVVLPGKKSLDIEITPNRPDCTSHRGIAREIALFTNKHLRPYSVNLRESKSLPIQDFISIFIRDPEKCPRYAARIVKNVKVAPSPQWMTKRLEATGLRSINNIVDASNYVLMELGHPLHTFDLDSIEKKEIVVRTAIAGETFQTLDGEIRELTQDHLLICDGVKPIALAGIMGGLNSEVSESTVDVLIESAYFDPITIRKGSKALGLSTEASKRFERGTDYEGLLIALDRCAYLITQLAGGEVLKGVMDVYPKNFPINQVTLQRKKAESIIGIKLSDDFIKNTLTQLEVKFSSKNGTYMCIQPTFRPDLEREIDLIEELARVYGYDRIKSQADYLGFLGKRVEDTEFPIVQIKQFFASLGFHEIISNSLLNEKESRIFSSDNIITLQNPLSKEMAVMRTSLFPGLFRSISYNLRRGQKDLALFEIGKIFSSSSESPTGTNEETSICGVICGKKKPKEWKDTASNFDYFTMKGYMEAMASFLKITYPRYKSLPQNSVFREGQSLISDEGDIVAQFGLFPSNHMKFFEIELPVIGFILNLPVVLDYLSKPIAYRPLSSYPGITRDLSLIVDKNISVGDIIEILKNEGGEILKEITMYDLYEGDQIRENEKSVTFNLFFQDRTKTLKDEEVDTIMKSIIFKTSKKLNAKLR